MKTNTKEQLDAARKEQLHGALRAAFISLGKENVTAFIDLVATEQSSDYVVKTIKEKVTIQKCTSLQIDYKVQTSPLKKDTMSASCCHPMGSTN